MPPAFSMYDPQSGFGDWFPEEFVPEPRRPVWEHDRDANESLPEEED